jgi:hypothetical protein
MTPFPIFFAGKRLYGSIHHSAGAFVATEFFHVVSLPLVPTHSIVSLGDGRTPKVRLFWPSVAIGYARVWGPLLGLLAFFARPTFAPGYPDSSIRWVLVAFFTLASVIAYRAGALSLDEERKRVVYAEICGAPVDPRIFADVRPLLQSELRERLREDAKSLAAHGYREPVDAERDWFVAASDPTMTNVAYLKSAFCLATLEGHGGAGALWERLKKIAPALSAE